MKVKKIGGRGFNKAFVAATIAGLFFAAGLTVQAGEYTDKSYHDSTGIHTYKHPKQGSFTSPFDYGPISVTAPLAKPSGCNCFTFDGTKSFDPDQQKLTYHWDFGDGQVSDEAVVNHCFEKAGDYNVTLTVRDTSGDICGNGVAVTKVTPNFPPMANAGKEERICLGDTASFDASASTSSGAAAYKWDFGDGKTGEGAKVTHVYDKAGNYRVLLTIDDGKGTACSVAQATTSASVSERVSVSLAGADKSCVGRTVDFDAAGVGASKYTWDFGDGATWEGGSHASHAYQKSGSYTVRVTADSGRGDSCSVATASHNIKVNASPIADAGANLVCCVNKPAKFDGSKSSSPDGLPLTYKWDFGDGTTADGAQATHAYAKSGSYRVILTVTDNSGSECNASSSSFMADVNAQPVSVIEVR